MRDYFFIHHSKRTGHFSMPRNHFHDQYEIYYLLSGERYYFIRHNTYRIRAGDIVFIGKNELHKTSDAGIPDHERLLINFDERLLKPFDQPDLLDPFRSYSPILSLEPAEAEWTKKLLFDMLEEARADLPAGTTMLQTQLAALLIRCARTAGKRQPAAFEHESALHRKIAEIVAYINQHYQAPLSLETVASAFYISPFHLSRTFKKTTGFAFVEYINTIRIKSAQALLRDTKWPVTRIAEETGFDNISHFGRVFKQIAERSPLEYRKSHRRTN